MNILRTVLSIGAGLLATAACYIFMSNISSESNNEDKTPLVDNQFSNGPGGNQSSGSCTVSHKINKSETILRRLDKFQVGIVNFARFTSDVVRSISLFIRAMRCYECDAS